MLLTMLLSLCILTYNRQTLLSKAIESVSMSNVLEHNRVELIILDNGSQDQTPNLLREFQSKLSFKVIREEVNMRGSLRFQQLARVAQGEWIIFLGDDDYFEVETLRQLPVILSETNAEVNMVSFAARIVDQEGRLLGDTFVPPESKNQQEIIAKLINQPIYFFPATIFRRNICEVNIQPTVFFFDWALMLLAVINGKVDCYDITLTYYRIHENQEQNSFDQQFRDLDIISSFNWLIQQGMFDKWFRTIDELKVKDFINFLFTSAESTLHVGNLPMVAFLRLTLAMKIREFFPNLVEDVSMALVKSRLDPRLVCNKMEIPLTPNYIRIAYEVVSKKIDESYPKYPKKQSDEDIEKLYLEFKRRERLLEVENMLSPFELRFVKLLRIRHNFRTLKARLIQNLSS